MSLTIEERKKLHLVLLEAFPTDGRLDQMVSIELEKNPAVVAAGENLTMRALNLILAAEAEGFLEALLRGATAANPGHTTLADVTSTILARLNSLKGVRFVAPANPYEACVITGGRFLVNRHALRTAVTEINTDNGERALVVNGGPISGKSYSLRFIAFLAAEFGHEIVTFDMSEENAATLSPHDLTRSIALQLGIDPELIPVQQAQATRWTKELAEWLGGKIKEKQNRCWFVLDGFSHPDLPPETLQFIDHLLLRLDTTMPLLRLALLSYTRPLPRKVSDIVQEETIASIERRDLVDFFERLFRERGLADDGAGALEAADKVLELIPAVHPERLHILSEVLEEVVEALFEPVEV